MVTRVASGGHCCRFPARGGVLTLLVYRVWVHVQLSHGQYLHIAEKQLQAINHQVALCREQQGDGGAKPVTPPAPDAGSPVTPPRADAKGKPVDDRLGYLSALTPPLRTTSHDGRGLPQAGRGQMSLELLEAYVTAKQGELRSNVLDVRPELAHLLFILTGFGPPILFLLVVSSLDAH